MTFYQIAVFLHVLAAFAMFAAMGIEWAATAPLQRATNAEQARPWLTMLASLGRVAGPSGITLLLTGIYMAMTRWGHQAWIAASLVGLITLAVLGGAVTGRRLAAIARESAKGELNGAALQLRLQDRALALCLRLRTAIGIGIVFLMTTKPTGGIAWSAFIAAIVLGAAWVMPAFGRPCCRCGERTVTGACALSLQSGRQKSYNSHVELVMTFFRERMTMAKKRQTMQRAARKRKAAQKARAAEKARKREANRAKVAA